LIIRSNVDFPAPDRPITPTNCPRGIARLTRSTARVVPKTLLTSSIASIDLHPAILRRSSGMAIPPQA
jgi:hypothetical protein